MEVKEAKKQFEELGFIYRREYYGGVEYADDDGLGSNHILIDRDGSVMAYQETVHEGDTPIDITYDMMRAVVQQLREFEVRL